MCGISEERSALVEASDDIVYACVDLEDGIKKRLITWDALEKELLERTDGCEQTKKAIADAKDLVADSLKDFGRDEGLVQAFRTYAIVAATRSALEEFQKNYTLIMDGGYHKEIVEEFKAARLVKACKTIGRRVVYESDEVLRVELMGRKVIKDLLSIFWEGAENYPDSLRTKAFGKKSFALMSSNYIKVFKGALEKFNGDETKSRPMNLYYRLQLVCDYIAGMTDSFATNLHKKLNNA